MKMANTASISKVRDAFVDLKRLLRSCFSGGTDTTVPILVSRVAPNTPADKCVPRLSEGDQVLQINGHDVTHAIHQDVVTLIQEARATNAGMFKHIPNQIH